MAPMMTGDRGDGREKERERVGEKGVREKGQARRDEFEPLKQRDGRGAGAGLKTRFWLLHDLLEY